MTYLQNCFQESKLSPLSVDVFDGELPLLFQLDLF